MAKKTTEDTPMMTAPTTPEEAIGVLAQAAMEVKEWETKTMQYGRLVEATAWSIQLGVKRGEIGKTIKENLPSERGRRIVISGDGDRQEQATESKGSAARYVILGRYHLRQWSKGETPLAKPVEIGGQMFESPVLALYANVSTFSGVFRAFKDAIAPTVTDLSRYETDMGKATQASLNNLLVPVREEDEEGNDVIRRRRVMDDHMALASAFRTLMTSPIVKMFMTPDRQKMFDTFVKDLERGKIQVAKKVAA